MHNLKNNSKINICKFSTRQGRTEAFWRPGQINRNTLFYKIAPPNSQFGTPKLTLYLPPPSLLRHCNKENLFCIQFHKTFCLCLLLNYFQRNSLRSSSKFNSDFLKFENSVDMLPFISSSFVYKHTHLI